MSHSLPTLHSLDPFFIFVDSMAAFCPHRKIPALSLETSWWTLSFPRSAKSLSLPLLETSDGKQHAERTSQVRALHADTLVVEACWSLSWLKKIELFDKLQHDLCCVCGGWRWQIYVYVFQYVSIIIYMLLCCIHIIQHLQEISLASPGQAEAPEALLGRARLLRNVRLGPHWGCCGKFFWENGQKIVVRWHITHW